jgi:hypothetical protein
MAQSGGLLRCSNLVAIGAQRTYREIVKQSPSRDCEIDELVAHFLLGHKPLGISRGYVAKMILESGKAMRAAQVKVPARIEALLSATRARAS